MNFWHLSSSLAERIHGAFSFFKENYGVSVLAQFWMPVRQGEKIILTTNEQPCILKYDLF